MILSVRNRLKILIYLGAGVLLVVALVDGGPRIAGLTLSRLAVVEAVLIVVLVSFDRWLWRLRPATWMLRTGPVLRGSWKGTVTSADSGMTYEAYLAVRQTYTEIELRLLTAESTSESTSSQLTKRSDGLAVVEYLYQNDPRATVRARSEIHFGAARLESSGSWPDRLGGEYWTSRRTAGELKFEQRRRKIAQTFEEARDLFEEVPDGT